MKSIPHRNLWGAVLILVLVAVIVLVFLALQGPATGNIELDIINGLEGGA